MPPTFIVFFGIILLLAAGLWFVLAKLFTKIGGAAEKAAKPFADNLKEGDSQNDDIHKV
jgi:hypothetical protein